ncbi:MAG: hypothetical protein RBQ91_03960 [Acholeplasma sp.]|nr:hypothetical protein [Acholeplasma sp.]
MSDSSFEMQKYIDEPLSEFKQIYKDKHHENVVEFITELVSKSNVDEQANRETVKTIRKEELKRDSIVKAIKKKTLLRGFLIVFIIMALAAVAYAAYQLSLLGTEMLYIVTILLLVLLIGLSLFSIIKRINPKVKALRADKAKIEDVIKTLYQTAWQQMAPLNDLFYEGMNSELFQKTIPLIKLDRMFDSKRFDYLVNRFGLDETPDMNRSTLYVQSGEINGNPFFICDDLVHQMGLKTYSGSITIHWTSTRTVNGKRVTQHHSQVLTATLDKPFPMYAEQPYLIYGNDAAPDLIFSREDSDAEHLTEKQIDRVVNKQIKKLEKKSEKSITKGENYTVMGNSEFEVLFGATNRNNEVQFRLLFTPLAQKQLLALMKEKEVGFGDDFDFVKHKKINIVYPEHLSDIKLDIEPSYFHGYDIDEIIKRFTTYQNDYFRHVYFSFAPILSIPLYQHTLPHEYIYKGLYDSYVSFYEHEKVVNRMNESNFKHPLSVTRNILKTSVEKSKDDKDQVMVTAYGYKAEDRVEVVVKMGGDGRMHSIPVRWVEYLPVSQTSSVEINVLTEEKEQTHAEKFKQLFENLKEGKVDKEKILRMGTFIATVINKD